MKRISGGVGKYERKDTTTIMDERKKKRNEEKKKETKDKIIGEGKEEKREGGRIHSNS